MIKQVLISALCVLLAGCGAESSAAPPPEPDSPASYTGRVMLYSSMQENQILALKEGFEDKYPNVTMDYYFGGTGKVLTKIATENQSGHVLADVIWVGDPSDYLDMKSAGILSPYISPQGIRIDSAYIDPDHYFTGARLMNVGIAYNTDLITAAEAPKNWNDLLNPRWNGQVIMTDPGSSGTVKYFVGALMADDRYGTDYFVRLQANGCELESGTNATHRQVAEGNFPVGICLDYVVASFADAGEPLAFLYPKDLISIYSPVGLVANCPNERNGKLLYDFILSREGQEILVKNNLMSIRKDTEQPNTDFEAIAQRSLPTDAHWIAEHAGQIMVDFDGIFQ